MPEMKAVGRVKDPEKRDFSPIIIPVIAYDGDGNEVEVKLSFRAEQPMGPYLRMMEHSSVDKDGNVQTDFAYLVQFLRKSILPESRTAWDELIDDEDLYIAQETLADLYEVLFEAWGGRPTRASSVSSTGRRRRTSQGASPEPISSLNGSASE